MRPTTVTPSRDLRVVKHDVETVIVGAGQAGLALSRCLTDLGREHLVIDRGRIAERWHSERWDSFRLLTPNWHTRLPGHRYAGPDPDGFMDRAEITAMFADYARSFAAPVLEHTTVRRVEPATSGWRVATDGGVLRARNVVVATGPHDRPRIPSIAAGLPSRVVQVDATAYRNPDQLPSGGVLVVGAGPTGQQLAGELARSGRSVHLAVGRHQRLPRSYRGRDAFWWLDATGVLDQTVDAVPRGPSPPTVVHPVLSGSRELGLDALVEDGVVPVGRLVRADETSVWFDGSLAQHHLDAERAVHGFVAMVDEYVTSTGLDVPPADPLPSPGVPDWAASTPRVLEVDRAGIRTVVWATGYRRDYSWLHAPVFDARGEPRHRRGLTEVAGLAFLGLSWLHRRKSASIDGVADDARHLAAVLAGHARGETAA